MRENILTFLGDIEMEHWAKVGKYILLSPILGTRKKIRKT